MPPSFEKPTFDKIESLLCGCVASVIGEARFAGSKLLYTSPALFVRFVCGRAIPLVRPDESAGRRAWVIVRVAGRKISAVTCAIFVGCPRDAQRPDGQTGTEVHDFQSGGVCPVAAHHRLVVPLQDCYIYSVARTMCPHHDRQINLPKIIGLRVRLGSMESRSTF